MRGDLRSSSEALLACRSRPAWRAPRAALLLAGALLAACGGEDAGEDAPAPPSTGIPLAAPNARGAPLEVAPPAPSIPPSPYVGPEELQIPPDPFGPPEIPPHPAPAGGSGGSGVHL
ncbi:hypothetical protein [Sorangium sp. So ce1182]|uniref:hypothetical protein n=1 Tax=Sorangium sp. So ce1182 TaxID=3133334 RepID=UPI003F647ED9